MLEFLNYHLDGSVDLHHSNAFCKFMLIKCNHFKIKVQLFYVLLRDCNFLSRPDFTACKKCNFLVFSAKEYKINEESEYKSERKTPKMMYFQQAAKRCHGSSAVILRKRAKFMLLEILFFSPLLMEIYHNVSKKKKALWIQPLSFYERHHFLSQTQITFFLTTEDRLDVTQTHKN